jgi:hypothetical protein
MSAFQKTTQRPAAGTRPISGHGKLGTNIWVSSVLQCLAQMATLAGYEYQGARYLGIVLIAKTKIKMNASEPPVFLHFFLNPFSTLWS